MLNNLEATFLSFCKRQNFEINNSQIKTIQLLNLCDFEKSNNKSFFSKFSNKKKFLGFYLFGDIGVGKTMILDFYFNQLLINKTKIHFNEFMINFYNFRHQEKKKNNNGGYIKSFVYKLRDQFDLIYLDEFQVTNIVDAMILGKLFETIFKNKIKVLLSSNIKIDDLYKDGLQRDQFLPFLEIIKKNCLQHELFIDKDYRKLTLAKLERYFYPINEHNIFKVNKIFRMLTKLKHKKNLKLYIKGRELLIENFYDGIIRFHFNELCSVNIGAEDYISIANNSKLIVIDEIPTFNDGNADRQSRFITLIDILYEKKIPLIVSSNINLNKHESSKKLSDVFKRTISRLFELTSPKFSIN